MLQAARSAGGEDDDDDDGDAPVAGKALRVERLLANLGYGKRRECQVLVKKGRVTTRDGGKLKVGDKVAWGDVVLDGEELDPPSPLLVALHKPTGYVVTSPDDENIPDPVVYDLLPYRFARRRPFLSCVGRLDKDTSGLLLLTDDGTLLHRINSPRRGIWKVYEATLADPMTPRQAEVVARKFASGSLVLEGDYTPLLPAKLERTGERTARVAICEGRYHQVRRMFAAVGNKVLALHRVSVGALTLGSLPEGEWRQLTPQELQLVFEGPTAEEILGQQPPAAAGGGGGGGGGGGRRAAAVSAAAAAAGVGAASDGADDGVAAPSAAAVAARDGGAEASTSTRGGRGSGSSGGSSGEGERRLTKKEKKKGRKDAAKGKGRAAAAEEADEGDEEEEEDFELLPYDDGDDTAADLDPEDDGEGGHRAGGKGRRRPLRRAAPKVRQGTVQDAPEGSLDEQLDPATYGISYDDEAADVIMSAGAGGGVRKYRDGDRWRRRREALRQMLPS
ncbi:hypothetical protein PLESTM_000029900 [Pleodorina starrii]|nr:hypothetical protein PLESTM_000029900 [Pleodorina starrii]